MVKAGNIVIEPQFDSSRKFSESLACVLGGEKFGYIDQTGEIVIEPQFAEAGDFSEDMAWIRY
ncbi:MAG: WG repeat-containing protein [Actinobacteria bacterium]|nr:MAG: WG repeat-containing protein [Actinomycetota bacterium]